MKKDRYFRKSFIRLRAALILTAVVLVNALFTTIIGVYYSNREITRNVSQNLTLVGRIAADIISSSIGKIQEDIGYVSSMMERAYEAGGEENLLQTLKNEVGPGPNFISLAVVFSDETLVSAEKENCQYAAPPRSQARDFLNIVPPKEALVANSTITESGNHVIRCYQKINDNAVGIFTLDAVYFSHLITESNYGIYNDGKVFLVDGNGYVLADSDQTMLNARYTGDGDGLPQLVANILARDETAGSVTRYEDDQAGEMICAYTPISGSEKWVLFIAAPISETPVKTMRIIFIIAGIIFIVLGSLSSIFLSAMQAKPYDELNRQNEQLEKLKAIAENASSVKSEFLSNMSHEIRTPLNAVIGMTSIGKSAEDIERKDYCFGKIEDASTHLLGVINDILDMSKIEAGKLELSPVQFDFEAMLKRVSDVIAFKIDEKRQKFMVHVGQNIPRSLIGDDQRLAQVITNLLGNAVKFTPDGGSITLNTRLLGINNGKAEIFVAVSDSGIGVSPEQQARLFTSFQQAESSTARKFGGTGLGLAISKRIVEMMNGKIWVESEIGHGSTFAFTIQAEIAGGSAATVLNATSRKSLKLLLIDDDPDVRSYFLEITKQNLLSCDAAASGEEALNLIQKNGPYDIYFIDWKMPGMDGIELSRRIKENKSLPATPVVIMISSTEWNVISGEAKEAGIDRFLQKPLFPSSILEILDSCVKKEDVLPGEAIGKPLVEDFSAFRLLLAEDIDINREIIVALLEPTHIAIDCAENGVIALRLFEEKNNYDIIFMDVQMPEMDGYEATRRIRTFEVERQLKRIPIIAMTANVFREDIEKCMQAGMDAHVGKPLVLEDVINKMKTYLRKTGSA
ncbi:MAG: response regulator [Treponema sp.]|jgi:signal transduction histidine kinase/DNA-binding response OmpR family regulator|nr:response regulator [Treponema sp.]